MTRAVLLPLAMFGLAIGFVAIDKSACRPSSPSPIHVAAVFFDGVNHGDYRQVCSVWEAARSKMAKCEAGMTVQMASSAYEGIFGGYEVVAHSVKQWRTGAVEYANVEIVYLPYGGQKLVAHMRKRAGGGWYVWYVA